MGQTHYRDRRAPCGTPTSSALRILIADDDVLRRTGLALVLARDNAEVIGAVGDVHQLPRDAFLRRPDLVITNMRLAPNGADDGFGAALRLRSAKPAVNVLVLSERIEPTDAEKLLAGGPGGVGFLHRRRITDIDEFRRAVHRVARGGVAVDPEVGDRRGQRAGRRGHAVRRLTQRQRDVLRLLAQGRSNSAIARKLGLSEKTVVHYVSHIYDHLELSNNDDDHRRVLAVVKWLSAEPLTASR